jgi:hypothetical protein
MPWVENADEGVSAEEEVRELEDQKMGEDETAEERLSREEQLIELGDSKA